RDRRAHPHAQTPPPGHRRAVRRRHRPALRAARPWRDRRDPETRLAPAAKPPPAARRQLARSQARQRSRRLRWRALAQPARPGSPRRPAHPCRGHRPLPPAHPTEPPSAAGSAPRSRLAAAAPPAPGLPPGKQTWRPTSCPVALHMPYGESETADSTPAPRALAPARLPFLQHYQAQAANADYDPDPGRRGRASPRRPRERGVPPPSSPPSPSATKPTSAMARPRHPELADMRASTHGAVTTRGRAESAGSADGGPWAAVVQ